MIPLAVRFWLVNQGHISSIEVAKRFKVFHSELTIAIQDAMGTYYDLGYDIQNTAPEIEVMHTKQYYDQQAVKYAYAKMPFTFDMFYYMKYPDRIPDERVNPEHDIEFQKKIIFVKNDLDL